MTVMVIRVS